MQNLQYILSLIGSILGLSITALTFLLKWIKNAKAKKVASEMLEISNILLPYIKKAEEFVSYSGEEKKQYVLTTANQYAIEHSIPFDIEKVSALIEDLVSFSKSVNSKPKQALDIINPVDLPNEEANIAKSQVEEISPVNLPIYNENYRRV